MTTPDTHYQARDGGGPRGANLPRVADYNERLVLDAVRRAPSGLSRVELTQHLGLVAQTISNVVTRLTERGQIREIGKLRKGPGKPRTLLALRPEAHYAIGVHIDPAVVTCVLVDFTGTIVRRTTRATPNVNSPADVLVEISDMVGGVVRDAGIPRDRLLGIGLASPGPIDVTDGLVLDPPLLPDWKQIPLRDHLATITMLPVLLEKDVFACAVAEWWLPSSTPSENYAFFYFGTGLGVGLVLNGVPFRGTSSNAGDIGTMPTGVLPTGRQGSQGDSALGQVTSVGYVLRDPRAHEAIGYPPPLDNPVELEAAFVRLCERADLSPAADQLLDEAARGFASSVLSTVNLLDLNRVVFGGPLWSAVADRFTRQVRARLDEVAAIRGVHGVELVTSAHDTDVGAVGAASLVLDYMFSPRPAVVVVEPTPTWRT